jgi:ATP/ADP translocase
MFTRPTETKARNLRRWVFWSWIAITVAAAAYVGALAPIATILDMNRTWIAVIVPPIMILLTGIIFIWLILYVYLPPRRDGSGTNEIAPHPER